MNAAKGLSMEKWFCWSAMGISGVFFLLFLLDLIIGHPFMKLSPLVDILGMVSSGLVFYLGWNAYQDLR
ncbi:MAG: hypothetical protein KatS3mg105_3125 [Gemmatales bacterium]|nr:MAG: hypothetical protein KatS3mg105_3125 [Gemmatales bacterium]